MEQSSTASVGPEDDPLAEKSPMDFLVVGIGASAGGLPALVTFFENMPSACDMAFVVVLHLSPTHESSSDAVLQRVTKMPVLQVTQRTKIEKNHVYVIAPNKSLLMDDGHLDVDVLRRPVGQHIAVDLFFRTLAEAHRDRAVAVILSGTGADGAVGLARIKEQGGITIAQEPDDAQHSGMPVASIRTGSVDFIMPVAEMPQKLMQIWQNVCSIVLPELGDGEAPLHASVPDPLNNALAENAMQQVISLLRARTGHDFRHYKRATVLRRIERRLQVRGLSNLPAYHNLLETDPTEPQALLQDMLIGVTNFFRDRTAFDTLERDVITDLCRTKNSGVPIRAWVSACSTGEEAYSMAMLLEDNASLLTMPPTIQVFASDIDERAINIARLGRYPASIAADVTPARLRQYFVKHGDEYHVRKVLRDKILFASHNLLRDPPFSKVDLISCRNLLIYLNRDVQMHVLEMFHFALNPHGILFLGSSESAESASNFFEPVDKKNRIYRARVVPRSTLQGISLNRITLPRLQDVSIPVGAEKPRLSLAEVHQRVLLQHVAPSMIVGHDDNIVHLSNLAGKYLRHTDGELSRNACALVLPALRLELRSALIKVKKTNGVVQTSPVFLPEDEKSVLVRMTVEPFRDYELDQNLILVMFFESEQHPDGFAVSAPAEKESVITQLEEELQRSRTQLQETIEHSDISTEELRASNEELQAINEELRSATEELETSKEELQSTNEELSTVNYELKMKVDETSKVNDDLDNLIASTDIATMFVDSALRIKRYTPRAMEIFSVIPTDIGRCLLDLTHRLNYPELADDAANTLRTLQPVEREVARSDGQYYIARILPYRTTEDKISGAVLTFFDITRRREAEEKIRVSEERMHLVAESTKDYAIMTLDKDGNFTSWNAGAVRLFGYTEQEILGRSGDIIFTEEDRKRGAPEDEKRRASLEGRSEDERWHVRKDGSQLYCSGVMTTISDGAFYGYAKIARDQTARIGEQQAQVQAFAKEQAEREHVETASATKDEFLAVMSHELRHPLNLIHLNAELLLRFPETRRSAASMKAVGVIRNAVLSQAKLIEDLLDMSRLRTGKLTLALDVVNLTSVVNNLVDAARDDPAAADLEFRMVGVEQVLNVKADLVRIEQVVLNLLGNAIKFTPSGAITVQLNRENEWARLDVIDTGQGIPPEVLGRVFDMYGQGSSSPSRSSTGLGIGLALVRQIIDLHGGRVAAFSSGAGNGAKFSVWLPLCHEPSGEGFDEPDVLTNSMSDRPILLVDDNADVVASFKILLEMAGATVHVATSGQAALALLRVEEIDILISDISMPDMDGYRFIREVRAMERHSRLPAIALSGLDRKIDIERGKNAGFNTYLSKPMSIGQLIATIQALLRTPA